MVDTDFDQNPGHPKSTEGIGARPGTVCSPLRHVDVDVPGFETSRGVGPIYSN